MKYRFVPRDFLARDFRAGTRVSHRNRPVWTGTIVGDNELTMRTIRIDGVNHTTIDVNVRDLAILPDHK